MSTEKPKKTKDLNKEPQNLVARDGEVIVTRTVLRAGKATDGPDEKRAKIRIRPFATHPASVSIKKGFTLNMGDYNSLRVDVMLTMPCYVEEMVDAYNQVDGLVDALIVAQQEKADEAMDG